MASTRERRANAGNRMSKLVEEEETADDDFYKSTYGGFNDEEDDNEFTFKAEEDQDDEVDSDFSIDENDEPISDHEEDGKKAKRGRVVTKAYKEPDKANKKLKTDQNVDEMTERIAKAGEKKAPAPSTAKVEVSKTRKYVRKNKAFALQTREKKAVRQTTVLKSAETVQRLRDRETRGKRKHYRRDHGEKLTQEELLEEAKETELLNIQSLEKYRQLELEKKKTRVVKKASTGPFIRYLSTSMPMIQELETERSINVEEEEESTPPADTSTAVKPCCERTFITFSKDNLLEANFNRTKVVAPQKSICPITRKPAKYFDPVTQLPYGNLQAFRILRETYYKQLELKGDVNDPEIGRWIEWRQKYRKARLAAIAAAAARTNATAAAVAAPVVGEVQQPQQPSNVKPPNASA